MIRSNVFLLHISPVQSVKELEEEMLGGQRLQGPETAAEVNSMLKGREMESKYVLVQTILVQARVNPRVNWVVCLLALCAGSPSSPLCI
jgi:hypothetical protein